MKKIIIPFLMSGLLCTGVCASEPSFDVESNKIVFDVSEVFGNVNIMVLSPEQNSESVEAPFYARQLPAGTEFTGIPMPENSKTGTYTVYVNGEKYGDAEYINIKTAENYLINTVVPAKTSTELETALLNSVGIFNVVNEENTAYIPKISEYMLGKISEDYTSFYKDFHKYSACAMLASGNSASEVLSKYESYLGINFKEDYDVLSDTEKERFAEIMKSADYINKNFTDIFNEAVTVAECAAADHWNVLKTALKNNADKIGINISAYPDFDRICLELMDKKNNFFSYEDIKKYLNEANTPLNPLPGTILPLPSVGGGEGGGGGSKTPSASFSSSGTADVTVVSPANPFYDLSSVKWAEEKITLLYNAGIINGVSSNEFAPERNVTRAEFSKMIASVLKISGGNSQFSDVTADAWYAPYINALADSGIVKGSDGKFMPDMPITRQDAAVILKRAMEYAGKNQFAPGKTFNDENNISDYAREAISALNGINIINGFEDNTFRPVNNLSRAESAVLIGNVYELL